VLVMAGRVLVVVCGAVPALALRPFLAVRAPQRGRSRPVLAQYSYDDLPAGWRMEIDPGSGTAYYCNENDECQWETPQQDGNMQQDQTQKGAADLPAGWTELIDQGSGAIYYYHEASGESQWERPQQQRAKAVLDLLSSSDGSSPFALAGGAVLVSVLGLVLASIVGGGGGTADLGTPRTSDVVGQQAGNTLGGAYESPHEREVEKAREIGREESRERAFEAEARREAKEERREEKELKREQQERQREARERELLLAGKP